MKNSPKTVTEGKETEKMLLFYMLIISRKCFLFIFLSQISSIIPTHSQYAINIWGIKECIFISFLLQAAPIKAIADIKPEATQELRITKGTKIETELKGTKKPWLSHIILISYTTTFRNITKWKLKRT